MCACLSIPGSEQRHGIEEPHSIRLLCYPRILGFAFNPLSVYFCYDASGSPLATLYEVRNTFGQRHTYLVAEQEGQTTSTLQHRASKVFYVSPFISVQGEYRFRIVPPGERILLAIRHIQQQRPLLYAVFSGTRSPLNALTALKQFLTMPLMTVKVVAAINWQALRLWLKGTALVTRPSPPMIGMTTGELDLNKQKKATP